MKKLLGAIATTTGSVATLISAQAADLPMAPSHQPPVAAAQQVYNWTGI
jgi:hypothetical protein